MTLGLLHRSRRDVIVDTIAFALAVGIGLAISLTTAGVDGVWAVADITVGSLACLALWERRRWPLAVALLLVPLGAVSPMSGLAAGIAVFSLAVHRPARIAMPLGVMHAASGCVYAWIHPDDGAAYWVSVVFVVLATGVLVGWGMFVRARRELIASLTDRAERAEAEQALRVERAQLAERERIAREMHDVLAHRLSLLSLHAGALEYNPGAPRADVERAAGIIRDNAHLALEELRSVIGALRQEDATPEPPQPTLADLPRLVEESVEAGMQVSPSFGVEDLARTPRDVGRHAYRVAQEGLTNARKHAPRSPVTLTIDGAPGTGLRIEVRNALPVTTATRSIPGAGAGLSGLGERVALAGGRIEHGHTTDGDYRLVAWLPWSE